MLELAGADYPQDKAPILGESAVGFLTGEEKAIHDASNVTVFSHAQRAYVRQGEWKLMTLDRPFDERNFELFNLAEDPGETTDLSARNFDKRNELLDIWRQQRRRLGIVLPQDL